MNGLPRTRVRGAPGLQPRWPPISSSTATTRTSSPGCWPTATAARCNLVYIDPPFDSGADYVRKVSLRGPKGTVKLDGETYTLGEQVQYTDIWANDNYLQFMYERLLLV